MTIYGNEEIRVKNYFTDFDASAIDPASHEIKLFDPEDNLISTWTSAYSESETGYWHRHMDIPSGADSGVWKIVWNASYGEHESIEKEGFDVESLLVDID